MKLSADYYFAMAHRTDPETARAAFVSLAFLPEVKRATLILALERMGTDARIDEGIFEVAYKLTSGMMPIWDDKGNFNPRAALREAARAAIKKELAKG